ncbi:MAG: hypothetical protein JSS66_09210 [Armatimonadetes bacterium]|nr:hypothetical protein [Armatimonadota bacterium]
MTPMRAAVSAAIGLLSKNPFGPATVGDAASVGRLWLLAVEDLAIEPRYVALAVKRLALLDKFPSSGEFAKACAWAVSQDPPPVMRELGADQAALAGETEEEAEERRARFLDRLRNEPDAPPTKARPDRDGMASAREEVAALAQRLATTQEGTQA